MHEAPLTAAARIRCSYCLHILATATRHAVNMHLSILRHLILAACLHCVLDITMDQARALRIRPLANFFENNRGVGAYAQIGANPLERIKRFEDRDPSVAAHLLDREWLSEDEIKLAAVHPTGLRSLSNDQFTRLERHGYESVQWNELLFGNVVTVPRALL